MGKEGINSILKGKLAPEALYDSKTLGYHEYRRQIELGEIKHPFEVTFEFLNRLTSEERTFYNGWVHEYQKKVISNADYSSENSQNHETPIEILAMRRYLGSPEPLAEKVQKYQREHLNNNP